LITPCLSQRPTDAVPVGISMAEPHGFRRSCSPKSVFDFERYTGLGLPIVPQVVQRPALIPVADAAPWKQDRKNYARI